MKRILKISALLIPCLLVSVTILQGQETKTKTKTTVKDLKTESKIKVIIDDGSGSKILIDTVIKSAALKDTLILKDGTVLITRQESDVAEKHAKESGNYYVYTVTSDDKSDKREGKTITVVSSDSVLTTVSPEGKKIMVYKNIKSTGESDGKGKTVIVKEIGSDDNTEKKFNVYVNKESRGDSSVTKSNFVLAKDGVVVTVEGSDEAKTREIFDQIEKIMGSDKEEQHKKVTVNVQTDRKKKK
jgi:hypothetical protein